MDNKNCIIFTRKNFYFGREKPFSHILNEKNAVVEHSCENEALCLQSIGRKVLVEDMSQLKVKELGKEKYKDKYTVLTGNEI